MWRCNLIATAHTGQGARCDCCGREVEGEATVTMPTQDGSNSYRWVMCHDCVLAASRMLAITGGKR